MKGRLGRAFVPMRLFQAALGQRVGGSVSIL